MDESDWAKRTDSVKMRIPKLARFCGFDPVPRYPVNSSAYTVSNNTFMLKRINCMIRSKIFGNSLLRQKYIAPRGTQYLQIKRLRTLKQVFPKPRDLLCIPAWKKRKHNPAKRDKRKQTATSEFDVPKYLVSNYNEYVVWNYPPNDLRLLKPISYIELDFDDQCVLGRLVAEIIQEKLPSVVLEFKQICLTHNSNRLNFLSLFPALWESGKLCCDMQRILNFHQQDVLVDVDKDRGDHKCITDCMVGFNRGVTKMTINLKAMRIMNGRRVIFEHVLEDLRILQSLKKYSTECLKLI